MESQYRVLSCLQKEGDRTQRDIAEKTGLSIGRVNVLIKKMVKKGLVKTENLDARSMRYIVTPKGMSEKVRLTCKYIKRSYGQIAEIMESIDGILAELGHESDIYLCGPEDEIFETVKLVLIQKDIEYRYCRELSNIPRGALVLTWNAEGGSDTMVEGQVINLLQVI